MAKRVKGGHGRARLSSQDLRRRVESGERHPYYLLYGEEEYERDQTAAWLLGTLAPAARDFNVEIFRGDGLDTARLLDAYRSYPVMATHRLVVLRNCDRVSAGEGTALEALVSDPVETSILVAVGSKPDLRRRLFREMAARGVAVEFRVPYDSEVPAWIRRHTAERGITLEPAAVDLLRILVGANLRELSSEIDKLVTGAGEGVTITARQVEEQVGQWRGASIFALTDAIGAGDRARAAELMHALLDQGEEPLRMLQMVSRHLQLLLKTQRLEGARTSREEMAHQLGVPTFFLQGYRDQARRVPAPALWRGLSALLEADGMLKSRGRRQQSAIMDLCLARLTFGQG
ncbi:MAG: DNA polymerase III subunit delta [Gemmatimonadota bacterium]